MFNKLSATSKRRLYNYEDEPPDKKLVSDGDIFIKQLAKKQKKTKVTLEELSSSKDHFYKATEEISVTAYTSGPRSLEEFNTVVKHSEYFEKLKSQGLTSEEIDLFLDHQKGEVKNRHKNLSDDVLTQRLEEISKKIDEQPKVKVEELARSGRLQTELMLSTKPNSTETRLMKFALENNKQQCRGNFPGPMDHILEIERHFNKDLYSANINKIRRKARSLAKQIETVVKPNPKITPKHSDKEECTKWDVKNEKFDNTATKTKIFTCKPLNYYTIKDGQIIKIDSLQPSSSDDKKLTLEEIKKLPKFQNYERGEVSKTLFLKNLPNGVRETDLDKIFQNFSDKIISIKVMTGRMQGQAFIEFNSEENAARALDYCNGTFLKNKPVIIQFGRKKS